MSGFKKAYEANVNAIRLVRSIFRPDVDEYLPDDNELIEIIHNCATILSEGPQWETERTVLRDIYSLRSFPEFSKARRPKLMTSDECLLNAILNIAVVKASDLATGRGFRIGEAEACLRQYWHMVYGNRA